LSGIYGAQKENEMESVPLCQEHSRYPVMWMLINDNQDVNWKEPVFWSLFLYLVVMDPVELFWVDCVL